MKRSVVLTIISEDRPGIVEHLSRTLVDHGGNWVESSMATMAGKFAGILLAEVPDAEAEGFMAGLAALASEGLHVVAELCEAEAQPDEVSRYSMELVGQDRPGIVSSITRILAKHHVNVGLLETELQDASMSGERLFMAHAQLSVPAAVTLEALQAELEELANELMVDIRLGE